MGFLKKANLTNVTLKWFSFIMNLCHMRFQITFLGKSRVTNITFELFFRITNRSNVQIQISSASITFSIWVLLSFHELIQYALSICLFQSRFDHTCHNWIFFPHEMFLHAFSISIFENNSHCRSHRRRVYYHHEHLKCDKSSHIFVWSYFHKYCIWMASFPHELQKCGASNCFLPSKL